MKRWVLATLAMWGSGIGWAHALEVSGAWARALPAVSKNGAVYLTVRNPDETPDALVSVEGDVADRVSLHRHTMNDGVMKMEPVDSFPVPSAGEAVLAPGGNHIMLLGLRAPLSAGRKFSLELVFASGKRLNVSVPVTAKAPAGAKAAAHGAHQHDAQGNHGADDGTANRQEHGGGHGKHAEDGSPNRHSHHGHAEPKAEKSDGHGEHGHGKPSTHHDHSKRIDVDPAVAPELRLDAVMAVDGGLILNVATSNFRFSKESVDQPHVSGVGHGHLYLDGEKVGRIFSDRQEISRLSPGTHHIRVSLHANSHEAYAVAGKPVTYRLAVRVERNLGSIGEKVEVQRTLTGGELPRKERTIRVKQGQPVLIRWESDTVQQLHLHGYDIETEVGPGDTVAMLFYAGIAGRFPIASHGHGAGGKHRAVAYIEVYPN
ncbi:MAG: copper chaperone PCu(A)C [Pseudomonadota bacterium]